MKKTSRGTKRAIIITCVLLIFAVLIGLGVWYYFHLQDDIKKVYEDKLAETKAELEAKLQSNERAVYKVKEGMEIKAGDVIDESNVEKVLEYSSMPATLFADSSDFGKRTLVNIDSGSQILKVFLTNREVENSIREISYGEIIEMTANIIPGNYVDVRLRYPDGTDYIVCSKRLVSTGLDGIVTMDFNEEDILMMDSAIVDAYLFQGGIGTKIYATKYVEPLLQDAAIVTYVPSKAAIAEINSDPNIVKVASRYLIAEARKAKEESIQAYQKILDPKDSEEKDGALRNYDEQVDYLNQYLDTNNTELSLESYDNIGAREDKDEDTKVEE
jgi:hypothetical protein